MFDRRLTNLRNEKGLNMKQTAKILGIPYTTYVGYEKNEREPNSEVLVMLADFFNCSVDYLIGRSNDKIDDSVLDKVNIIDDKLLQKYGNIYEAQKASNDFENKIKNMTQDKTIKWARAMPIYKTVELYDSIDGYSFKNCIGYTHIGDIEDFDNCICVTIPDDCFIPNFNKDDIALIYRKNTKIVNEKYYYFILNKDNIPMIRKIVINNNILALQSDNSNIKLKFVKPDEIKMIGEVISLQKNQKL